MNAGPGSWHHRHMTERSRRNKVLLVLALVLGVPAVGVAAYGMFAGFEVETEAGDRERVVTVDDLRVEGFEPDPARERLTRTRYIDGSYEVEYEYTEDLVYVWSLHSRERSERDARSVYTGQLAGGALITAFDDEVELRDRKGLLRWGDQSDTKVFVQDGVEFGYVINARKGKDVYGVIISGSVYEPDALEHVVAALERAQARP